MVMHHFNDHISEGLALIQLRVGKNRSRENIAVIHAEIAGVAPICRGEP